jgi:DNA-binding NtrC family response regulator
VMVPAMESHAVESVVDARPGASGMDTVRRDTVRRDTVCKDTVSDEFADELLEGDESALPRGGIDLKDHLSAIEIGLIRKALEEADGTVAGAARLLNIRRTTLVEKLRKYRLSA